MDEWNRERSIMHSLRCGYSCLNVLQMRVMESFLLSVLSLALVSLHLGLNCWQMSEDEISCLLLHWHECFL